MSGQSVFDNRRILITGGLGFIGSNLAHRLVRAGARVTLVDSLIPEYGGNPFNLAGIENDVRVNVSDVRDVYSLGHLVRGQDYLFNLAGQTSHLDSMESPESDLEINCRAQLSILEVCRRFNPGIRIVFASTRQIYGKPDYLPVDEKHPTRPIDVNGINKLAGESYHLLYSKVYGLQSSVLRLTNTYGPRMRVKDARQTFLGVWLRKLIEGEPIEVWGGSQLRDFNFVDDVVDALLLAAETPKAVGDLFNLGAEPAVSLGRLAEILVEVYGRGEIEVCEFPEDRKRIDIGDYYADYARARSVLGWVPRVELSHGLEQTIRYYEENLDRYR